jgi:hypothetical protein
MSVASGQALEPQALAAKRDERAALASPASAQRGKSK